MVNRFPMPFWIMPRPTTPEYHNGMFYRIRPSHRADYTPWIPVHVYNRRFTAWMGEQPSDQYRVGNNMTDLWIDPRLFMMAVLKFG